ncbi:hypothetical protein GCM10022288_26290 [Gryllotalpicola kribbensis]|uniref:DUF3071 domain-containing protein n=1 Tax=Gryllotalpicola kribbensis TaxID=993084 RepID=A0ABP8AXM0_9MICO
MQKGGNGDGVSHSGDSDMDDDALAAAMERHFAPFASGDRSVPVPIPHDAPDEDAELDVETDAPPESDDPEVTAITRRLDRTGDTLGAITELEHLLIERTGQIPVVTPELLAAHAARLAAAEPPASDGEEAGADAIDWSIRTEPPLDPAPGFSEWVDPQATAAAFDPQPAVEFTDVSTKVFAVFSADRAEADRPAPQPDTASAPEIAPTPTAAEDDDLEGIDDLAPEAAPVPPSVPVASPIAATPEAEEPAEPEPQPEQEPPRRRRLWPFGRR